MVRQMGLTPPRGLIKEDDVRDPRLQRTGSKLPRVHDVDEADAHAVRQHQQSLGVEFFPPQTGMIWIPGKCRVQSLKGNGGKGGRADRPGRGGLCAPLSVHPTRKPSLKQNCYSMLASNWKLDVGPAILNQIGRRLGRAAERMCFCPASQG